MSEQWKNIIINEEMTIQAAMEKIEELSGVGLVVVDKLSVLRGTLTDGDIRRGILKGASLNESVLTVLCADSYVAVQDDDKDSILKEAKNRGLFHIPVVNNRDENIVVNVLFVEKVLFHKSTSVILMAGGLGSRLGDLTKNCPKPLLKVAGKPVLERIINGFKEFGFMNFYISVNYKGEMIEEYFEDGKKLGCSINYIKEPKRLGTAGSLSLLPVDDVKESFIVMNGDLLTGINFNKLLDFHKNHDSKLSMCVREHEIEVPYGVVNLDENELVTSFDEKPIHKFYVNAGIYVISPGVLQYIPQDEYCDMSTLLDILIDKGIRPKCFYMHEHWIDIGKKEDFDYAEEIYNRRQ